MKEESFLINDFAPDPFAEIPILKKQRKFPQIFISAQFSFKLLPGPNY